MRLWIAALVVRASTALNPPVAYTPFTLEMMAPSPGLLLSTEASAAVAALSTPLTPPALERTLSAAAAIEAVLPLAPARSEVASAAIEAVLIPDSAAVASAAIEAVSSAADWAAR